MSNKTVSVVITCYNYGRYVEGCIRSVLAQTFQDFEVIVVNDGSTDDSEDRIKPFLKDERIKYIKQPNSGQAKAKNRGIQESSGKFIAFLDADDLWDPTKLEKQLPLFEDPKVGVVYSRAKYIDADGKRLDFKLEGKYLQPRSGQVTEWLIFDNFVPFSSSVVRRECLEKVGLFDESLAMGIDWDLWLKISVNYEFGFVDEPLLIYRIGHSGQMSKNTKVRRQCAYHILKRFQGYNKSSIPMRKWRSAWAYSWINTSRYYRDHSLAKAIYFYLLALLAKPSVVKSLLNYFKKGIKLTH